MGHLRQFRPGIHARNAAVDPALFIAPIGHDSRVPDYLIRTAETHEWPAFHRSRNAEVLIPQGRQCEEIEGFGDFRMRCGDAEISFSGEEPGWHVVVEGPLADAEAVVEQVTRQVEQAAGEPCEWIPIG